MKSVGEYAADNDKLQNRVSELEEREVAAQQERKAVEAKNKAMHEDISRSVVSRVVSQIPKKRTRVSFYHYYTRLLNI